jgi:hypothetical protein
MTFCVSCELVKRTDTTELPARVAHSVTRPAVSSCSFYHCPFFHHSSPAPDQRPCVGYSGCGASNGKLQGRLLESSGLIPEKISTIAMGKLAWLLEHGSYNVSHPLPVTEHYFQRAGGKLLKSSHSIRRRVGPCLFKDAVSTNPRVQVG